MSEPSRICFCLSLLVLMELKLDHQQIAAVMSVAMQIIKILHCYFGYLTLAIDKLTANRQRQYFLINDLGNRAAYTGAF